MSDMLQEEEDQKMNSKASGHGFDQCQYDYGEGIRCYVYRNCHENQYMSHRFTETDYCPECKGPAHAPWCSQYERNQRLRALSKSMSYECWMGEHVKCTELESCTCDHHAPLEPTSEPQPAAQGGGDDGERVRQIQKRVEIGYSRINQDLEDPYTLGERLGDTEYLLNQHQSLVAERETAHKAIAYLVLNGSINFGQYWPDGIVEWAKELMRGEQRTGGQLVREAIGKDGEP